MTPRLEIPEPAFDAAVECIRELPQGAKLANLDHHDLTRAMFDAALPHLLDWFAERLTSDEAVELREGLLEPPRGIRRKIARELADVVYLAYRTAHVHSIDLDEALRIIHAKAMEKIEANVRDGRGKIIKPPGFVAPDLSPAVRELPTGGDGEASATALLRRLADEPSHWQQVVAPDLVAAIDSWAAGESAAPGEDSEVCANGEHESCMLPGCACPCHRLDEADRKRWAIEAQHDRLGEGARS